MNRYRRSLPFLCFPASVPLWLFLLVLPHIDLLFMSLQAMDYHSGRLKWGRGNSSLIIWMGLKLTGQKLSKVVQ